MGEEEKKPEEKKPEQEAKKDAGEEKKKEEPPKSEEKKAKAAAVEESKDSPPAAEAAPPPPQEIILKLYMHCEGCARKVHRCLKGFEGVEDVLTDCRASKVVVKGDKADPLKVLERVQRKSHRPVELISPIPKPPPPEEPKKVEEKEAAKPEEKKEELPVLTVVLKVHMHCEACAQAIKRRIQKIKGVESAEPDLKSSEVTVKGVVEPPQLVDFIYKRTGKQAVIVKVEQDKKEGGNAKEGKEEKKGGEGEKDAKKAEDGGKEGKESGGGGGAGADASGGDVPPGEAKQDQAAGEGEGGDAKLELKKNEFYYYYYPQSHVQHYQQGFVHHEYYDHPQYNHHEYYDHSQYPPQMFSDENPNACSVM